jgi:hypothetical protein
MKKNNHLSSITNLIILVSLLSLILITACGQATKVNENDPAVGSSLNNVSITNQGNYFNVILDYTNGATPYDIGSEYAIKIKKIVPDIENLIDSFLVQALGSSSALLEMLITRVNNITPNIHADYVEEMNGLASQLANSSTDALGDGKLSKNEYFVISLAPDILHASMCSAFSVFGKASATNTTITGRNLDWFMGNDQQLLKIQAITTFKNQDKSIVTIGFLGFLNFLTGFNDNKVFAGILDASTSEPYTSMGKRSYTLDIRYALENKTTLAEVADYLMDTDNKYTFNHLVFLSDPNESKVLENALNRKRALRSWDSELDPDFTWHLANRLAAVNCFALKGNSYYKDDRWDYTYDFLNKNYPLSHSAIQIGTAAFTNQATIQSIIFQPQTLSLQVFFRPHGLTGFIENPEYENISIIF